jgi:hypothetical protein
LKTIKLSKISLFFSTAAIVVLSGVVIYLASGHNNNTQPAVKIAAGYEYEDNVTVGEMPGVDREAILEMLQNNADKTAIAFTINGMPTVTDSTINLLLENPEGNGKDISVRIIDSESKDVIYESKVIPQGSYLTDVVISKNFTPGFYEATAYITAYDTETHERIGQAAAGLTLEVPAQ